MLNATQQSAPALVDIYRAIGEGRCILDTAWGRRRVVRYCDRTGWAVTNNRQDFLDQRSFLVCASDFIITGEPVECVA